MVVSVSICARNHELTMLQAHTDWNWCILLHHVGRLAETPSELQTGRVRACVAEHVDVSARCGKDRLFDSGEFGGGREEGIVTTIIEGIMRRCIVTVLVVDQPKGGQTPSLSLRLGWQAGWHGCQQATRNIRSAPPCTA
jgi:hypothetical protein